MGVFSGGARDSDIEVVFCLGDYFKLCNAVSVPGSGPGDVNGSGRIVACLARGTEARFTGHGRPADALVCKRDVVLSGVSEAVLSRFERLFTAINDILALILAGHATNPDRWGAAVRSQESGTGGRHGTGVGVGSVVEVEVEVVDVVEGDVGEACCEVSLMLL
ncbi:hypothetical protein GTW60_01220 [Streptomyces sp. SID4937]|uniref:hypothetical protein n=1 Tax=Streptomyces sp. SID4937 TaxID=2690280 RepID=UPI00114CAA7E|nr:hypothetical protein [Streptomyces sp. SID4937]MYR92276.1 hypothetical protein [Streptomyces sp. SID4937]